MQNSHPRRRSCGWAHPVVEQLLCALQKGIDAKSAWEVPPTPYEVSVIGDVHSLVRQTKREMHRIMNGEEVARGTYQRLVAMRRAKVQARGRQTKEADK